MLIKIVVTQGGGGWGSDDHDFLTIWPASRCHGKFLTMTKAKISKWPILTIDHDVLNSRVLWSVL